ncbi:hypothetical protein KNJ79_05380 [Sphingopyxis indica]|uniref:hypothetical protein n=1 Tax=Sphingopyxis indica TaxID=436663 RepID=UPI002938E7BE|nr:hypothetical protein [Sphingopyxis indica]WOF44365.1 hypothetical protein KNJ79_05380 [Sphingopyxis indica]
MGAVQKNAFMLSSATLMMAPAFTNDVYALTPGEHSVGMIKEVAVPLDSSMIELKNGVAQATVDSKRTGVQPMITGTAYEFTAANIARSLAMGGTPAAMKRGKLDTALAGDDVSLSLLSDPVPGEATSAITALADIPAGSTLLIQRTGAETDYVFPTKSSGVATGAGPYVVPLAGNYAIPTDMSFPIGSKVWVAPAMHIGDIYADDLFCVKITGTLSNYDRPVTCVFPKVKVSKGFNLQFTETDYGGMPWELLPLLMSASEAIDRLADIGTGAFGDIYIGA